MNKIQDDDKYKLLFKIALVLALMIGYGIYSNIYNLGWFFIDANAYQQTVGQILSSTVEAGGIRAGWRFNIVYKYKVGGQEFVSSRVHFGYQGMSDPSYAENYVAKYPVGKQVVVFYQEINPANSVLEPEIKWSGLLDFYITIALLPIAVFGLAGYFFIRSRQHHAQARTSKSQ